MNLTQKYLVGSIVLIAVFSFVAWVQLSYNFILVYIAVVNIFTVVVYIYDKSIAASDMTRVPENVLHFYALIGGSPAALLMQRVLRHKISKRGFQLWYFVIVLIQILLVAGVVYMRYSS